MELLNANYGKVRLNVSRGELVFINNILNEVCNGFRVPAFATRLGIPEQDALQLLGKVHNLAESMTTEKEPNQSAEGNGRKAVFELSRRELTAITNALAEVIRELGIEEFEARVGTPLPAGKAALAELNTCIAAAGENRN